MLIKTVIPCNCKNKVCNYFYILGHQNKFRSYAFRKRQFYFLKYIYYSTEKV